MDVIGTYDIDRPFLRCARGDVAIIAAFVFSQIRRPYRANGRFERGSDGLPIHKVAAVPNYNAGIGIKTGKGQIIIIAVA